MNVGIDRQKMCDEIFAGHATPEYTSVDTRDYANDNAKVQDGDVAKAKEILKEGGWTDSDGDGIVDKDGVKASFDLYYPPDYLDRQSLSTVFAEQAKEIGIEVNLKGADWDTIYANMYSSAALMQQTSPDPYKSIYQQYHRYIKQLGHIYITSLHLPETIIQATTSIHHTHISLFTIFIIQMLYMSVRGHPRVEMHRFIISNQRKELGIHKISSISIK